METTNVLPDLPLFAQYILDLLLWLPRKIYELITDAFDSVISTILSWVDVSWLASIDVNYSALPQGVLWFLGFFNLPYAATVITSALMLRFFIRRLPIFG